MLEVSYKNNNPLFVLISSESTKNSFDVQLPCKLSYYNLRRIIESTTSKDTSEFNNFFIADKFAEVQRLNKVSSVIAILAIISQRNHAWKEWIRNSLVCFSICELEIRYSYAGIKN